MVLSPLPTVRFIRITDLWDSVFAMLDHCFGVGVSFSFDHINIQVKHELPDNKEAQIKQDII